MILFVKHLTVVVGVLLAVFQVSEEIHRIHNTACHKPEGGNNTHYTRYKQCSDVELPVPPLAGPWRYHVPNSNSYKHNQKSVNQRICKHRVGNDPIPKCVFRSNTDKFAEHGSDSPFFFRRFRRIGICIGSPVQKFIQIVRLVGKVRTCYISDYGNQH